jgi:hypothetical protein
MTRCTVVSASIVRLFVGVLGAGLLAASMVANAADTVSISPNTDPGGLQVGDSLDFRASVDSVTPPAGDAWDSLGLFIFRVSGPDNFNFSGECADLSGLDSVDVSCASNTNGATWDWRPFPGNNQTVAGNLFSFTALFDQPGTYRVYLERGLACFEGSSCRELTVLQDNDSPIVITVSEAEPADADADGIPDDEDNCPDTPNGDQADADGDDIGDACDPDDDNDDVLDEDDNCPTTSNLDQQDFDEDGIGDACDDEIGPPTNTNQCKNGGWQRFDFPRTFKNQGDCTKFVKGK